MKRTLIIQFILIASLVFCSANNCVAENAISNDIADGADILCGTWKVGAILIDSKTCELDDFPQIASMYEWEYIFFKEDGSFSYLTNAHVIYSGYYQRMNPKVDDFLLYYAESTKLIDEGTDSISISDGQPDLYISLLGDRRLILGQMDDNGQIRKSSIQYMDREEATEESNQDFETEMTNSRTNTASVSKPSQSTSAASYSPSYGEQNALATAKSYLDFTAFSYSGLIEQLEYEGFSHSEAKYAADHCGADWNEQAEKSVQQYLDFMSFSRHGLIEQLEYEGFTHNQAVYGVEKAYK